MNLYSKYLEKLADWTPDKSYQSARLADRARKAAHLNSDVKFTKQPVQQHDFEQRRVQSLVNHAPKGKLKKHKAKKFSIKKPRKR